jgi:hypothetical protein
MIRIEYASNGAKINIINNGYNAEITPLHAGRQYAENEAETIVVAAGMLVYSCEDGSFVVLTTGNKKAVFDVVAPVAAPAPAEPVFTAPAAEPEAPAA